MIQYFCLGGVFSKNIIAKNFNKNYFLREIGAIECFDVGN